MNLIERLKKLIAERAEKRAGLLFVDVKRLIVEVGCAHVDEAIAVGRKAWDTMAKNIDWPLLPEPAESQLEDTIGDRLELGARQFAEKFCPADASSYSMSSDELTAIVEDTTLPELA